MTIRRCSRCGEPGHTRRTCDRAESVSLAAPSPPAAPAPAPGVKLVQPRGVRSLTRTSYGGATLAKINAAIKDLESGRWEQWADLAAWMARRDTHVRSVIATRANAVAGSPFEVEPPPDATPQEDVAAELCREELEAQGDVASVLGWLLQAVPVGLALGEHHWRRVGSRWTSRPTCLATRDVEICDDWDIKIKSYRSSGSYTWVKLSEHPGKFICHKHAPSSDTWHLGGELLPVAWQWMFKRTLETFRNTALERFAAPFLYALVPENTPANVRDAILTGLENLTSDGAAVFEKGVEIMLDQVGRDPGEAFERTLTWINGEISKSYLGSGLNVEVASTGGNRALGESQFDTTMLPRLESDARRLANTIESQWFAPFLRLNGHLVGGAVRVPTLRFKLVSDEPVRVDQLAVDAAAVTVDEVRASYGLEPWGAERGGDRVVQPIAKAPLPGFSRTDAVEGEQSLPFSRRSAASPSTPITSSTSATDPGPTPGASTTPLRHALLNGSGRPTDS